MNKLPKLKKGDWVIITNYNVLLIYEYLGNKRMRMKYIEIMFDYEKKAFTYKGINFRKVKQYLQLTISEATKIIEVIHKELQGAVLL